MRKLKKNMMKRKKGQITLGGFEIGLTLVMLFGLFFALSLYMFFSSSSAKENSVDLSLEIARISSAQDNLRINIFTTGNFEFDVDDYIFSLSDTSSYAQKITNKNLSLLQLTLENTYTGTAGLVAKAWKIC